MRRLFLFAVVLCGCGIKLNEQPISADASVDGAAVDASPDATVPLGNFNPAAKISGLSLDGAIEDDLTLNTAETELIFAINLGTGNGGKNLYVTTRANQQAAWGTPAEITALNTAGNDSTPRLSADGLTLYYATTRTGTSEDVWMSQRASAAAAWGTPTMIATASSTVNDRWYSPCGGKYILASDRAVAGDLDLYEGTLGQAPSRLALSTTGGADTAPFLTPDCLSLYWAKDNAGQVDLFLATRASVTSAWQVVGAVPVVSTAAREEDPWLSADGRRLYFASAADGELDLYLATR
ncbi:MAG: PD40 domain-containing protein [Myxococcales bacterium]|nr:PD40 domain-containing protein [Myxococcales bacterium]